MQTWHAKPSDTGLSTLVCHDENGIAIAVLPGVTKDVAANAALMAAAPELLAACEELMQCIIADAMLQRANFDGTPMGRAQLAITKAKGAV